MSRVRYVQIFDVGEAPAVTAFTEAGQGVGHLFMDGLEHHELRGRHSEMRFFVHAAPERPDVEVEVLDEREGFESVLVRVPPHVAGLSVPARALLVLDTLRAGAGRLGELRGWDAEVLDAVRDHVLDRGLLFTWFGDWKRSPDGRHEVRAAFWSTDRGDGCRSLQMRISGAERLLTWSEELDWPSTWEGFVRSQTLLRWSDDGTASLERLTLHPDSPPAGPDHLTPDAAQVDRDQSRPPVTVLIKDDTWREVSFIGGVRAPGGRSVYADRLDVLLGQLEDDEWQRWWMPADLPTLEVSYWVEDGRPDRVFVRRSKGKLIARIDHSPAGLREDDPLAQADEDVARLLSVVGERMGLGAPPPLDRGTVMSSRT